MYTVPSDTLVVTQPGEVHHANWMSERDCTFRGLRIDLDLLQQVALEIAGHKTDVPFFPMPLVYDRDLTHQIVRVHQALSRSGSQLEQQTTIQDLVVRLILRCAANPPCLTKLGTERQPIERVAGISTRPLQSGDLARATSTNCRVEFVSSQSLVSPNIWNATARISNSVTNFKSKTTTQTGAIDRESSH